VSASQRQEASSKRTPEEQLARLDAAGLVAKKERAKLAARIKARDTKAVVKTPKAAATGPG
jgi:hypothetical protein